MNVVVNRMNENEANTANPATPKSRPPAGARV